MSQILAATSDQVLVRPDDDLAFWDLVCADDDWLRAEFDAIVASEYPDRCGTGRPRPSAPRRPGPPSRGPRLVADAVRASAAAAPVRLPARQRSPPPPWQALTLDVKEVVTCPTHT